MNNVDKKIIVVLGPTSSGKTRIGVKLAKKFNGEIISADSRQVYKGMDVGTGKDLKEYRVVSSGHRVGKITYHLIDVVGPNTEFNVAKFQKLGYAAIEDILQRGKIPMIVGGTGLYISAITEGYVLSERSKVKSKKVRRSLEPLTLKQLLVRLKKIDPKTYKIIDKKNRRRVQRALEIFYETGKTKSEVEGKNKPPYDFLKIGLIYPREVIFRRIDKRLEDRLEKENMIGEVRRLHKNGVSWKRLEAFGLEYKWLARYLQKKVGYQEMVAGLAQEIKNFSKRQIIWFKRDKDIIWTNDYDKIKKTVSEFLN
ncbi:MAG: tRNA (adenosine(37)-N6)-dimethylallyltransferase MiaA [Patescibacteria group bacterium]|jgi:tRNA dimethylallyltransferase